MNRQAPNQDAGIIPWPSGIPYEEARQLYEKSQESLRLHIENVEQDPPVSNGRIRNLNLDYDLPGPEVAEGAADTAEIDIEALLKSLGIDPDLLISDMVKKPPLENPDKTERRNAVSGRVWGWFIDPNNHKTAMSVLGGLPDGGRPEPYDRQFGMPQRLVRGGLRFGAPDHNPHQISLLEVHPEKELQIKRKWGEPAAELAGAGEVPGNAEASWTPEDTRCRDLAARFARLHEQGLIDQPDERNAKEPNRDPPATEE